MRALRRHLWSESVGAACVTQDGGSAHCGGVYVQLVVMCWHVGQYGGGRGALLLYHPGQGPEPGQATQSPVCSHEPQRVLSTPLFIDKVSGPAPVTFLRFVVCFCFCRRWDLAENSTFVRIVFVQPKRPERAPRATVRAVRALGSAIARSTLTSSVES